MAELSTIARPYAEALFGVAKSNPASLTEWSAVVADMAQVAQHSEVKAVITDPHLNKKQRFELFASLFKTPLSEQARNFIQLLVDNDRILLLPEIASQFHLLKNEFEKSADAEIISAFELTSSQLADLVEGLEKKLNVKINATVRVDASLIGGVRVEIGDQVLDASVKARLAQMKDNLIA